MSKFTIKTFKRYLKEDREKYYTLQLIPDMSKQDVVYLFNELQLLTQKMLKNGEVLITVEPILDSEEQ